MIIIFYLLLGIAAGVYQSTHTMSNEEITDAINKYIDIQTHRHFGHPHEKQSLPRMENWKELKKYVARFKKGTIYYCPICSFQREKNIEEVASCFVRDTIPNFFTCPGCNAQFSYLGSLITHCKSHCNKRDAIGENANTIIKQNIIAQSIKIKPTISFLQTKNKDLPKLKIFNDSAGVQNLPIQNYFLYSFESLNNNEHKQEMDMA